VQLEGWNLGLLGVLLFAFAGTADEDEIILLSLLRGETMALAMLPHTAPVACDAVRAVVHIFAMLTADGAIEIPISVLFGQFFQFLLVLLALGLPLTSRCTNGLIAVSFNVTALRLGSLGFLFQLCKFLFVQDALGLALAHSLLTG
jgi:hypothetical protein